ncbi:hypothetical protein BH23CYA1_BH23CYA1_16820 [soil metagenome]
MNALTKSESYDGPQKLNRSILLSQVIDDAGKWTILTCKEAEGTMTLQNINLSFPVE